ncbi:MAG: hypothetical protein ACK4YQ_09080 [Phenylobacterium sp.]|uniref:hypothetical protein n=1 Tax=Phenylobacterium sp. TaxID=1871053 RepID=UPI00391C9857
MGAWLGKIGRWRSSPRVAVAVEAACLAPALALLVLGASAWGGYFMLAHELQLVADDALAAAVAELDVENRERSAWAEAERHLTRHGGLAPDAMRLSVMAQPRQLTIMVVYDASRSPVFAFARLMPMPSPTIVRSASGRLDS